VTLGKPADLLLALGTVIGLIQKTIALKDPDTTWTRKSSGLNIAFYPFTALLPMYLLQLHAALAASTANLALWTGIYLFRAPDNENLVGLTTKPGAPGTREVET